MPYRGRFAPTPSGPLHFGSLVAAVGSYLDARSHAGEWLLRIDDLDPPRVAPGAIDAILRCLERFGFEWDRPVLFQSRRGDAYHAALHRLHRSAWIYPCACSRKEIAAYGRPGADGYVYPGTCSRGIPGENSARCLRIRVRDGTICFKDRVLGERRHDLCVEAGDFPVYRADRVFAFHLATAVDDAEHGITDIVRGADLLHSSARQIYLQRVLGFPQARYAHLPIAVDEVGEKLSKQTGAAPLDEARPVSTLCQVLGFLGQQLPAEAHALSLAEVWRYAVAHWNLQTVPAVIHKTMPRQAT
jgi:glutamyl-Q tRNA(Asp) synthetase